jgi:peptidyl-prolyl cis-trans isomerase C
MPKKRGTCFWAFAAGLILVFVAMVLWAAEKKPSENIVAKVNGKAITREDFKRMESNVRQSRIRSRKSLVDSEIKKEALENLIKVELLYQESQKRGVKVDEKKATDKFSKWKKRYPTEEAFKKALDRMKLTEASVKEQIKREMAIEQLVDKEVAQKVTVSDEEVKAHFEKVKEQIRRYLKQGKVTKEVEKYISVLKEKAKVERFMSDAAK